MRSSATMPTTSVFSANQPSGRRTNVLAAPTAAATGETVVATDKSRFLERHRQRQPGPLRAEAREEPGQVGLAALDLLVNQSVRPSAA